MPHVERTIDIAVEPERVWGALSDLGAISMWNPNVASADCGDQQGGVGATRTCFFARGGHIEEVVSEWVPGRRIQFAIGSHGGVRSADMTTALEALDEATQVTFAIDYHLAFGPLGPVVDRMVMKRQMLRMLDAALEGLRGHLESERRKTS